MTLRDNFVNKLIEVNEIDGTECEKIADDYALKFKKWCDFNKSIIHSDEELLEIFKKEKGL
jgi:hypothetical protein